VLRTTRTGWTPMPDKATTDRIEWHAPADPCAFGKFRIGRFDLMAL
jgi:hypothetical protein